VNSPANIQTPPTTLTGIVLRLGPGMIIAGSIVGSGELIATTKTGAEAGFWLLWLIVIGCVIKVFVQVEFGRYSLINGKSTMAGLAEVPGPRIPGRGNWIVWYWLIMWLAGIGQLGGIVGGVGQALALSVPLTRQGRDYNRFLELTTQLQVKRAELLRWEQLHQQGQITDAEIELRRQDLNELSDHFQQFGSPSPGQGEAAGERPRSEPPPGLDDRIWAGLIALVTSGVLMLGRYRLIQLFATLLVASFTAVTVVNLMLLQGNPVWAVTWNELASGLSFRLPPTDSLGKAPLATALATFGIIGVGATELVAYPYWCLEKGYALYTGPRDGTSQWSMRARGWMRVMRWDAWCSMVVYTFATVAFYLLGAAILNRTGLNPGKNEMIRTLAVMYEPVFGSWAPPLFLFGAFAVLYSTFFVANAGHARVFSDMLTVIGAASSKPSAHERRVVWLGGFFPLLSLIMYLLFPADPARLVLISGVTQAIMLPMLAAAALYFRYRRIDQRVTPSRLWDGFLWISSLGMLVAGVWALISQLG
jgi:Mn2+/Fe2+ NRAMP family transporter